jgi:1-pyrroline-5-carboxylate dehydrogenase
MDAITSVPAPVNEPVKTYAPGSSERTSIEGRLAEMAAAEPVELTAVIGGEHRHGGGDAF